MWKNLAQSVCLACAFLAMTAGCGDDDTPVADAPVGGGPDADPLAPDGGNPPGASTTLTLEPFPVQPGTERQVCKTVNLPAGAALDVVQMHSTMVGTSHHFNAYKVLTAGNTDPVTGPEGMVADCDPAGEQLNGDAAYIFGSAAPERTVDMPSGVAFHFLPGQRIILEQHVINGTDEVVQGGVTFDLIAAGPTAVIEHHADIMWMANWAIYLPPGPSSITEFCTVPYDVQVFGLMSHTHKLGTVFTIDQYPGGANVYESTDWAHPTYQQFGTPLALTAGQGLEWTCNYANTTGGVVTAGKNSTDEMCMTFAYAYPTNSLSADPVQCNKPFAP